MSVCPTLEERISSFLGSLPGAESIDKLISTSTCPGRQRADYLLEGRRIIVELKTLKIDPASKIEAEMEKYVDREDFPLIYGTTTTDKVLAHLPDGEHINSHIHHKITNSVEGAVTKAEEQIEETRKLFSLPDSVGLLVLLNETIDVLSPEVVGHRVATLMCRDRTGKILSPAVHFAWLLMESHITPISPSLNAFPSILICGPDSDSFPWFPATFDRMQEQWARQNYGEFLTTSVETLEGMEFHTGDRVKSAQPKQIRRQEMWEREYDARRFLKKLNDEELLAHGSTVIAEVAPYFLKGGPRATRDETERMLRELTYFMREANYHRALDMRKMPKPRMPNT